MISASGSMMGSRRRISLSSMRQNATTGAPVRSEPKLGKAWAWRPPSKAAMDSISAPVTTPCPPRPWMRTWNMLLFPFVSPGPYAFEHETQSQNPECAPLSKGVLDLGQLIGFNAGAHLEGG